MSLVWKLVLTFIFKCLVKLVRKVISVVIMIKRQRRENREKQNTAENGILFYLTSFSFFIIHASFTFGIFWEFLGAGLSRSNPKKIAPDEVFINWLNCISRIR